MGLLIDKVLRPRILSGAGPLVGPDLTALAAAVSGCSVDLHVGDIFDPGASDGDPGSSTTPRQLPHALQQGGTALVRSLEEFRLEKNEAALVFPTSSVSIQGLLMTNPGHVDPGYQGHVHVTVINMGRAPYALKRGDRLLRALIFRLDEDAASTPRPRPGSVVTPELLDKLALDFMNVNERTAKAAKLEVDSTTLRTQRWQIALPLLAAAVTGVLAVWGTNSHFENRIQQLEKVDAEVRLSKLSLLVQDEKRFQAIETQIQALHAASAPALSPARRHR